MLPFPSKICGYLSIIIKHKLLMEKNSEPRMIFYQWFFFPPSAWTIPFLHVIFFSFSLSLSLNFSWNMVKSLLVFSRAQLFVNSGKISSSSSLMSASVSFVSLSYFLKLVFNCLFKPCISIIFSHDIVISLLMYSKNVFILLYTKLHIVVQLRWSFSLHPTCLSVCSERSWSYSEADLVSTPSCR